MEDVQAVPPHPATVAEAGVPPQWQDRAPTVLAGQVQPAHPRIVILAGTDSNHTPGIPVNPHFGSSLHHELELLVGAGLSTVEALRSATVLPAQAFRLPDRGVTAPGYRADLVLIDGGPIADIRATRRIQRL